MRRMHGPTDLPVPPEVLRADPVARRVALVVLLVAVVSGSWLIGWFLPWLSEVVQQRAAAGRSVSLLVCTAFAAMIALLGAPVAFLGVRVVKTARASLRTGRVPPPGARVLRDTRVLTGRPAVIIARVQAWLGVMLVLCALALSVLGAYALVRLT